MVGIHPDRDENCEAIRVVEFARKKARDQEWHHGECPILRFGKKWSQNIGSKGRLREEEENLKFAMSCVPTSEMFDEGRSGLSGKCCRGFCNWGMKKPSGIWKIIVHLRQVIAISIRADARLKKWGDCESGGSGNKGVEAVNTDISYDMLKKKKMENSWTGSKIKERYLGFIVFSLFLG